MDIELFTRLYLYKVSLNAASCKTADSTLSVRTSKEAKIGIKRSMNNLGSDD